MAKHTPLGKGLDSLLAGEPGTSAAPESDQISGHLTLAVEQIKPGKYQPRAGFDTAELEELANSIRAHSLLQPIVVREVSEGTYEIIAGERRWRAAQQVGLTHIPVVIADLAEVDAAVVGLVENLQRTDLTPYEQATAYNRLANDFGLGAEEIGHMIGKSRSTVVNSIRLLQLSDQVLGMLQRGEITEGHARALLSATSHKQQEELAKRIQPERLTVAQVDRLAKIGGGIDKKLKNPPPPRDPDQLILERELADHLGTAVQLKAGKRGTKGTLLIKYRTLEKLQEIVDRLKT